MGRKTTRRSSASSTPPTATAPASRRGRSAARRDAVLETLDLPVGEVLTSTGTVEIVPDPDGGPGVTLLVNGVPSSHLDLADPGFLAFEYMQQMAAIIAQLPPGPVRAVHLGAAGCALARHVEHERPDSRQVAVDLDGDLVAKVREWFALPRAPRLRLRAGDARAELATLPDASADLVVRDVFAGDTTPEHVATAGFLRDVLRVLRPGGVYLANCADRPPLDAVRRELATAAAVLAEDGTALEHTWERIALVAEPGQLKGRRYGNLVLAVVRAGLPDDDDRQTSTSSLQLDAPGLDRALRSLPVPATMLTGSQARRFAGTAVPVEDAPLPAVPAEAPRRATSTPDGPDAVGRGED